MVLAHQRGMYVARVDQSVSLCREHFGLTLRLDSFPAAAPGQFVQVACRDLDVNYSPETEIDWNGEKPADLGGRELMNPLAMLRRPFSLAGRREDADGVRLELIQRVVGVGTSWLAKLKAGDRVHVIGPLGNGFTLPEPDGQALLVGGGVGIPPMLFLASRLAGRRGVAFCGAVSRDLLPLKLVDQAGEALTPRMCVAELAEHGVPAVITTDDGSYGHRGVVTEALEAYLNRHAAAGAALRPIIYTCGPEPMMKRVAAIGAAHGLEVQVAVERAMACGMGTCQSCCIRVRKADKASPPLAGNEWAYKLACTDGPVFKGADLMW